MRANKATASDKERQLVIAARTWFCLYLFEHQLVTASIDAIVGSLIHELRLI